MESAQPQPAFPKPFVPAEMELGHGVKKKKINLFLTVCFVDELFFSWLCPPRGSPEINGSGSGEEE